ncbi:hypothetical protein [Streptomyces halobius]|uniref:MBD domain-containing protein n=1 Tax=Streptomyces halobius TaxID=2879846 RepID=A0ABY4MEA3_9ACTN|nr:hypothetical protein [Streptomyces halobius]UQA95737.1 hypothetical protein K9S39_31180 [Streptomyces halobius]
MAAKNTPVQIPSRACGCWDCLIDYPPSLYGPRPPHDECQGMWRVRYRSTDGRQRRKSLPSYKDAVQFLAQPTEEAGHHGA